ncbi:MAG TPA: GNAT family protein [Flavobacterium sp.]|jgi:RimJ/RimL family protein N-acetyltransferase
MIEGKLATEQDFDAYYFLKSDEENIKWSGHEAAPDKERMLNWYLKNIKRNDRHFFLFWDREYFDHVVGYLYMDVVGQKSDTIDTGHGVHSNCGGKGYGTQIIGFALQYATENLPQIHHFQGWIANDNIGSIKNVLKNGYYKTNETKPVAFADGEMKTFEKYMIDIRQ